MIEEVARFLDEARVAYQREQYPAALAYFRKACQVDPHSIEALLGLGEVASFLDLRDEAVNAFLGLADVYLRASMLEVASEVIDRILELEPSNAVARRFQGFIHSRIRPSTEEVTAVTQLARPTPRRGIKAPPRPSTQTTTAEVVPDWETGSIDDPGSGPITAGIAVVPRAESGPITDPDLDDDDDDDLEEPLTVDDMPRRPAGKGRRNALAYADTALLENGDDTDASPVAPPPAPSDPFADVSTRLAPDGLMEQIARESDRDPFDVETVAGDLPSLLALRTHPDFAETSETGSIHEDSGVSSATGSGSYPVDAWERHTSAAVVAENIRTKPRLQIDTDMSELDPGDFPPIDDISRVTATIYLEGADIGAALGELVPISPLLGQLTQEDRRRIADGANMEQCFAGQIICREGAMGSSLYLILSGQVAVERVPPRGTSRQRVASLTPGAFFGEGGLLADTPRSSTVRVIEDAMLLEIPRALMQELARERPELLAVLTRFLRARMVSSLMMSSPLFLSLDADERHQLAPLLHLHKLNTGQVVVEPGQVLTGFCVLMAGELERVDLASGTGKPIRALNVGDCFGTDSIGGTPSPVGLRARTACWLMRLPTPDLEKLVDSHPGLLLALRAIDATL